MLEGVIVLLYNPYTESKTLIDLNLYVRNHYIANEVERIVRQISYQGRSSDTLITGEGGSGKTSLLTYIRSLCNKHRVFPFTLLLGSKIEGKSPIDFYKWIEDGLTLTVRQNFNKPTFKMAEGISDRFSNFIVSLGLGPISVNVDAQLRGSETYYINEKLPQDMKNLAESIMRTTDTRGILIMFDDADKISAEIFETFRNVFHDNNPYTIFIVSGKSLFMSDIDTNLLEYNKRLTRPYDPIEILPAELSQCKEILYGPLAKVDNRYWYSEEDINWIWRMSKGNPYIIYSLGKFCFDEGLRGNQIRLTLRVLNIARRKIWGLKEKLENDQELVQQLYNELEAN